MFCAKCGKEMPDGERKVCEECEKSVVDAIVAEEKEEKTSKRAKWEFVNKEVKNGFMKKIIMCVITIFCVALVIILMSNLFDSSDISNTIGNIRNYGYASEDGGWIYFLSPNEENSKVGIFKVKNNGKDKQQIYMSEVGTDIVSINAYKGYIYFIGSVDVTNNTNDVSDNKIYRMKTDGTALEVLNDNELNNACYEIYVVNDEIYYIGVNSEICKMDLNGSNKTVIANNGTGYIGITEEYIIYNDLASETGIEYVTYIMNLDGTDAKPIIEGKRLYSVSIEGKYIYYSDSNKRLYRTEIGSNKEELLYDNIEVYNLNTNDGYAYYLDYLDTDDGNRTVCLFRVKLDGSTKNPEKLKEMESYSSFVNVVGKWVMYMDSTDEVGLISLINKNGKGDEVELYRLDYEKIYGELDEAVAQREETEEVVEEVVEEVEETESKSEESSEVKEDTENSEEDETKTSN